MFYEVLYYSSNKAEKQMFEAKTVIEIKLQYAGNGLLPVFRETEQQIDRKIIYKTKLKNPFNFLKTNIFISHNWFKPSTNSGRLGCNTSANQLGILIMRLSHDPTK